MSDPRDVELGTHLDELEVREHEDGYWSAVMAAAAPELERLREEERASRRGSLAAFVERHPTLGGGFKWWATAAVTAAVAIALLLVGLPGGEQATTVVGPAPATAAEAADYTLNALDRYPGLEGTLNSRLVGATPEYAQRTEVTFVADRDGSLWLERRWQEGSFAPHWVKDSMAYDARARALRILSDWSEIQPTPSGDAESGLYYPRFWSEATGLAPAEPDRDLRHGGFPLWRVRAYLRTMIDDPEARLATIEKDGRAVWVLSAETIEEDWSSGVGIEPVAVPVTITIDAATRLPLALEHAAAPHVVGEVTTFDLRPLSEAPARDQFTLQRPDDPGTHDGSASVGGDQGFRDLPLGDDAAVREATSAMAAFPRWVPRGFTLSASTAKDDEGWTEYRPAPGEPKQLVRMTTVSLAFRRGYDQAFVSVRVDPRLYSSTTRGTGEDKVRIDTSDPFVTTIEPEVAALWAAHTADVPLEKGAFAGVTAHVVTEPDNWPHLWVRKGPYVACVAGDLTQDEMLRIAESLGLWSSRAAE